MRLSNIGDALLLCLVLSSLNSAWAGELSGKVIGVSDGDTITVLSDGQAEKIRLADIDCPEKKQPFGQKAKQYCSNLCFGKSVVVSYASRDRYKRIVGRARLPNGSVLNEELVKAGMAWCYVKYCKIPLMFELERQAKQSRLGLWRDDNPTPPWLWREQSRAQAKPTIQKQLLKSFGL